MALVTTVHAAHAALNIIHASLVPFGQVANLPVFKLRLHTQYASYTVADDAGKHVQFYGADSAVKTIYQVAPRVDITVEEELTL